MEQNTRNNSQGYFRNESKYKQKGIIKTENKNCGEFSKSEESMSPKDTKKEDEDVLRSCNGGYISFLLFPNSFQLTSWMTSGEYLWSALTISPANSKCPSSSAEIW